MDVEAINRLFAGPEKKKRNAFTAGLSSGVDDLQGMLYGAGGAVADAVGADGAKDWLNAQAARNQQESAANGRPDLDRIEDQSLGSAGPFLAYQLAKQVPMWAGIAAAGAVAPQAAIPAFLARAGAVAPRVIGGGGLRAGASFAERKAGLEAGRSLVGEAAAGSIMGLGSMYNESVEAGDASPYRAMAMAPFYGLAEAAVPAAVKRSFGAGAGAFSGGLGTRMAKAGALGFTGEAGTEALQNEMEMSFNPNLTPEEQYSRRLNSALTGGIVGAPLGALGGLRGRAPVSDTQPTNLLALPAPKPFAMGAQDYQTSDPAAAAAAEARNQVMWQQREAEAERLDLLRASGLMGSGPTQVHTDPMRVAASPEELAALEQYTQFQQQYGPRPQEIPGQFPPRGGTFAPDGMSSPAAGVPQPGGLLNDPAGAFQLAQQEQAGVTPQAGLFDYYHAPQYPSTTPEDQAPARFSIDARPPAAVPGEPVAATNYYPAETPATTAVTGVQPGQGQMFDQRGQPTYQAEQSAGPDWARAAQAAKAEFGIKSGAGKTNAVIQQAVQARMEGRITEDQFVELMNGIAQSPGRFASHTKSLNTYLTETANAQAAATQAVPEVRQEAPAAAVQAAPAVADTSPPATGPENVVEKPEKTNTSTKLKARAKAAKEAKNGQSTQQQQGVAAAPAEPVRQDSGDEQVSEPRGQAVSVETRGDDGEVAVAEKTEVAAPASKPKTPAPAVKVEVERRPAMAWNEIYRSDPKTEPMFSELDPTLKERWEVAVSDKKANLATQELFDEIVGTHRRNKRQEKRVQSAAREIESDNGDENDTRFERATPRQFWTVDSKTLYALTRNAKTLGDALKALRDGAKLKPQEAALVRVLLRNPYVTDAAFSWGKIDAPDVVGWYRLDNDTNKHSVLLKFGEADGETLLHEAVHAASDGGLRIMEASAQDEQEDREYLDSILAIYERAKTSTNAYHYGLTNVREFISEAFTNPEFQAYLKTLPSVFKARPTPSLWADFVGALRRFFGLGESAYTLLDETINVVVPVLRGRTVDPDTELDPEPDVHYSKRDKFSPREADKLHAVGQDFMNGDVLLKFDGDVDSSIPNIKDYTVFDADGNRLGNVTLSVQNKIPTMLVHIEAVTQRQGMGDRVVRAVTATAGQDGLYVFNIKPEAHGFWDKMGVLFETDGTQENGVLHYGRYQEAQRRGTQADSARGDGSVQDGGRDAQPGTSQKDEGVQGPDEAPRYSRVAPVPHAAAAKTADATIAKLPLSVQPAAHYIWDSIGSLAKSGLYNSMFMHDLVDAAKKFIPSAAQYNELNNRKGAEVRHLQGEVESILNAWNALPQHLRGTGALSVNKFIHDATTSQKWAYRPDWAPTEQSLKAKGHTPAEIAAILKNFEVDPAMAQRFNAMPPAAQKVVKDVFAHGRVVGDEIARLINEEIEMEAAAVKNVTDPAEHAKLEAERKKKIRDYGRTMARMQGPYAPLKRFGDYVVVGMSDQYKAAKEADDKAALAKLEADEAHYKVQFAETEAEARAIEREYKAQFPNTVARQKELWFKDSHEAPFATLQRIKQIANVEYEGKNYDPAVIRAINKAISDLYISALTETHARKAELKRRNIAGSDLDMFRAFGTQGRANAHFLGALKYNRAVNLTLQQMRDEKQKLRDNDAMEGSQQFNAMLQHHALNLAPSSTPIQDQLMGFTSFWQLLTSPGYVLQNLTQPILMSVPVMGARFGQTAAWGALMRGYGDVSRLFTKSSAKGQEAIDITRHANEAERKVLAELRDRGLIDIGINSDLGNIEGRHGAMRVLSAAQHKLSLVSRNVEIVNRVSTALAAYRLAIAKAPTDHVAALKYATEIIERTHGNYAQSNAPLLFKKLPKIITQFRKFQLIQLTLLARLTKDSFKGASAEERAVARRALAWTLGHTFAVAGGLGLPAANVIGWILAAAFGDDDEPKDAEVMLRRALGNDAIADMLIKGVPAAAGVDLSRKLGMGSTLSLLPFTDIDLTSRKGVQDIALGLAGPFIGGLLPRMADGLGYMSQGNYYKGVEGLMPKGLQDAMKAARFSTEGVSMRNGDTVLPADEITLWDTAAQALGLPSTRITDRQFVQGALIEYENYFKSHTAELKTRYNKAMKDGDDVGEIRDEFMALQDAKRRNGFKPEPLSHLLKGPAEQAKRERNVAGGVEFKKTNKQFVASLSEE